MSSSSTVPTYRAGSCAPPSSTIHPLWVSGTCRPLIQHCASLMGWGETRDPPPAPHIPLWDSERYLSSLSTIATYLGASCRTPFQPAPYNLMGWVEMQPLPAPPSPIQDSQSCATTPAPYRILGWGELHPLNFPPPLPFPIELRELQPHSTLPVPYSPYGIQGVAAPPSSTTQPYGVWGLQAPCPAPCIPRGVWGDGCSP